MRSRSALSRINPSACFLTVYGIVLECREIDPVNGGIGLAAQNPAIALEKFEPHDAADIFLGLIDQFL